MYQVGMALGALTVAHLPRRVRLVLFVLRVLVTVMLLDIALADAWWKPRVAPSHGNRTVRRCPCAWDRVRLAVKGAQQSS